MGIIIPIFLIKFVFIINLEGQIFRTDLGLDRVSCLQRIWQSCLGKKHFLQIMGWLLFWITFLDYYFGDSYFRLLFFYWKMHSNFKLKECGLKLDFLLLSLWDTCKTLVIERFWGNRLLYAVKILTLLARRQFGNSYPKPI